MMSTNKGNKQAQKREQAQVSEVYDIHKSYNESLTAMRQKLLVTVSILDALIEGSQTSRQEALGRYNRIGMKMASQHAVEAPVLMPRRMGAASFDSKPYITEQQERERGAPDYPDHEYAAANFGADGYTAPTEGSPVDDSGLIAQFTNWFENKGDLGARFGDGTIIKRTVASKVFTLDDTFIEGHTIYLVSPTLQANRGAYVFQVAPDATTFTAANLIGVVVPDIDVEELGSQLNVLGTHLEVGIQQSTGADASVKAFSNMMEAGVCTSFPIQAFPGKLGFITQYKKALNRMITSETMGVADHTCNLPDNLVRSGGDFDVQSENVRIPEGYVKPKASSSVEGSMPFQINAFASADNAINAQMGLNGNVDTETDGPVVLWQLSKHESFFRHMLLDGFTFNFAGDVRRKESEGAGTADFTCDIHYIDGTTLQYRQCNYAHTGAQQQINWNFVHDGAGDPHDKKGVAIVDIVVTGISPNTWYGYRRGLGVTLKFHAINGATRYCAIMITGAKEGQTLHVTQYAQTEIKVDPTGDIGRFLEVKPMAVTPNEKLVGLYDHLLKEGGGTLYIMGATGGMIWGASTFTERMNTLLKRAAARARSQKTRNVLRDVGGAARVVGDLADDLDAPIVPIAARGVSSATDRLRRGSRRLDRMAAATFSITQRIRRTGFQFPIVSIDGRGLSDVATVCHGAGQGLPTFLLEAGVRDFHSHPSNFEGQSSGLAFLLAYLATKGAPCLTGMFSGEIRSLRLGEGMAIFNMLPVRLAADKLAAFGSSLIIYSPEGLLEYGNRTQVEKSDMFAGFKMVEQAKIPAPDGFPDNCVRVTIRW